MDGPAITKRPDTLSVVGFFPGRKRIERIKRRLWQLMGVAIIGCSLGLFVLPRPLTFAFAWIVENISEWMEVLL
jgi:hypothetical protein